ncbi:hypothetical protein L1987_42449 [Smallanthus sonchifolius]|uniref:Uncharacterized protein n=1 Tax=Smallanthus sonchifolius TaxID=185202 RepID=A0ACB9GJV9_9ASTR|nr:hypothetical protein L1987_42449 [Smallanthus sonchifolius]
MEAVIARMLCIAGNVQYTIHKAFGSNEHSRKGSVEKPFATTDYYTAIQRSFLPLLKLSSRARIAAMFLRPTRLCNSGTRKSDYCLRDSANQTLDKTRSQHRRVFSTSNDHGSRFWSLCEPRNNQKLQ